MVEQIPCRTCGRLFEPRKSGGKPQVRCSERCRRKVANANYTKKNAPLLSNQCLECGGVIVQSGFGRPRRYCSDTCKAKIMNRAAGRRRLPVSNPDSRECAHCGQSFKPSRRDQIYCPVATGTHCAQKAYVARRDAGEPLRQVPHTKTCVECGAEFATQSPAAKWCSKSCRIRTASREASRRRGPTSPGWAPYSDREIFERDDWICQICFVRIDRAVSRTHPDGATIDHVIPLSKGGADEPGNVVAAHWRCNRDKGNRT